MHQDSLGPCMIDPDVETGLRAERLDPRAIRAQAEPPRPLAARIAGAWRATRGFARARFER